MRCAKFFSPGRYFFPTGLKLLPEISLVILDTLSKFSRPKQLCVFTSLTGDSRRILSEISSFVCSKNAILIFFSDSYQRFLYSSRFLNGFLLRNRQEIIQKFLQVNQELNLSEISFSNKEESRWKTIWRFLQQLQCSKKKQKIPKNPTEIPLILKVSLGEQLDDFLKELIQDSWKEFLKDSHKELLEDPQE